MKKILSLIPVLFSLSVGMSQEPNECPVAIPQLVVVQENGSVNFQLLASDAESDPLLFMVSQGPAHGTVTVQGGTGAATYTPATNYCGPDSFDFRVSDEQCGSAPATVSIIVNCTDTDCPIPRVTVPPSSFTVDDKIVVIVSDFTNNCIVLDASSSSDPNGDPLTFNWFEPTSLVPFATGPVVTNCLNTGTYSFILTLSDGTCTVATNLVVQIFSPCGTIHVLISTIENSNLPPNRQRPLIASLEAACDSFDRGQFGAGANQLEAFLKKVDAKIADSNPTLAQALIAVARGIIHQLGGP